MMQANENRIISKGSPEGLRINPALGTHSHFCVSAAESFEKVDGIRYRRMLDGAENDVLSPFLIREKSALDGQVHRLGSVPGKDNILRRFSIEKARHLLTRTRQSLLR